MTTDPLALLRRHTRAEAASLLNVPESWLRRWVTEGRIPHQRSGKVRGVWFTYNDVCVIGRMLPELMVGSRQAASVGSFTPMGGASPSDPALAEFAGLRSLRTAS